MSPRTLESHEASKTWTDSHEDNCRRVKARLLELNPGYNVFIYWSKIQRATPVDLRPHEWTSGKFFSKPSGGWWKYEYFYFVFTEGIIRWDGSAAPDKLCITDNNYERIGSEEYRFQRTTRAKVNWGNWMGELRKKLGPRSSQLYLSSLALPATHNSHALSSNIFNSFITLPLKLIGVATFAQCQDYTVKEQLDMGVRSLDFRVGPGLKLRHGLVELKGCLEDVVKVMSEWLDCHDQETIMFQAKWDMEPYSDENRCNAAAEVDHLLLRYPRALVTTEQPKLSECVGKLVLYNDNGLGAWKPQGFVIPPFESSSVGDVQRHCDWVVHALGSILPELKIDDKIFYDVCCSKETLSEFKISGKGKKLDVARPIIFADALKGRLLWWMIDHRGGSQNNGQKARLGRIYLDFVNSRLANEIVLWNFDDSFI